MLFGLLNLNKPRGWTSRQAVDRVQRLVRPAKVGHAGTLDPLAVGVLVVCVGPATRLIERVQQMPKRYCGTFLLGRQSDTEDVEGQVRELVDPSQPSRADIEQAARGFIGEIEQKPPAFSALKVGGRRAYDLARQGVAVDLAPRTVRIDALEVIHYAYPELTLDIRCGGGTYVRSLGRDLAQSLGTAAVMSALVRTEIGPFTVEEAVAPQLLSSENLPGHLQSPLHAVTQLPRVTLTAEQLRAVAQGRTIDCNISACGTSIASSEVAAVNAAGQLVALLVFRPPHGWGPTCNFPQPE